MGGWRTALQRMLARRSCPEWIVRRPKVPGRAECDPVAQVAHMHIGGVPSASVGKNRISTEQTVDECDCFRVLHRESNSSVLDLPPEA